MTASVLTATAPPSAANAPHSIYSPGTSSSLRVPTQTKSFFVSLSLDDLSTCILHLTRSDRTLPVETVAAPVAPSSSKSNPFGDAKPITDEERERRMQAAKVPRVLHFCFSSFAFETEHKNLSILPPSTCSLCSKLLLIFYRPNARGLPLLLPPPLRPKRVVPLHPGGTVPRPEKKAEVLFRAGEMAAGLIPCV